MTGPGRARPVTVIGDVAVDIVARHGEPLRVGTDTAATVRQRGGGAGANVAAWLAHLGVPTTLVGRVGADAAGRTQDAELSALGVRCALAVDPELPTGCVVVLVGPDRERTMLPDRGANLRLTADDVPPLPPGGHLHVSGYTLLHPGPRPAGLAALAAARRSGVSVSVDPASAAPLVEVGPAAFLDWTSGADLLLPNLSEARVLSGQEDPRHAARWLARHFGAVVISLGADGALWAAGGETALVPAAHAEQVLDTTGAGDALTAGVLASWVTGVSGPTAVRRGTEMAAAAIGVLGARPVR
ncbi:MAG: hypothetical protein HY241_13780 [Actinobacteria bacterium]|nr:hypothetical protein [Actinomycetota bacterium]